MPTIAKTTGKPGKTAAAKKPAAPPKQASAAAKSAKSTAASPARKSGAPAKPQAVSAAQRRNYVEVAAYYIAERNGFTPGRELADWAAAEAEIDRLLAEGRLHP